jgi:quercetin dioxygenase-like cupin family protein
MAVSSFPAPRPIRTAPDQDPVAFLETVRESAGRRTLVRTQLAPGGGSAPHAHRSYDEYLEVVAGTVTVVLGDAEHVLGAGELVVAPAGTVHALRNHSAGPATVDQEIQPGHRGFEKALQVAHGLAADGAVRPDGAPRRLADLAILVDWAEMELMGPARALRPLLRVAGEHARRRGYDHVLEERYCRH